MKSNAHVLLVGKDEMLLQTRKLILGTYFQVETAGRVSHAAGLVAEHRFDLIVLCYSLADEECMKLAEVALQQEPRALLLTMSALGRPAASVGVHQEINSEDGPYALLKKCAQMLGVDLKAVARAQPAATRRTAVAGS